MRSGWPSGGGHGNQSLGGMAEYALCANVFDAPPELDDIEAAAFTCRSLGWLALHERAGLQAVSSARAVRASAVGTAAIQLARAAGPTWSPPPARAKSGCAPSWGPSVSSTTAPRTSSTPSWSTPTVTVPTSSTTRSVASRRGDVDCAALGGATCRRLQRRPRVRPDRAAAAQGVDGELTVVGVILAYLDPPSSSAASINPFPPETGRRVHAALLELVAAGAIRPTIGRRVGFDEVAAASPTTPPVGHRAARSSTCAADDLRPFAPARGGGRQATMLAHLEERPRRLRTHRGPGRPRPRPRRADRALPAHHRPPPHRHRDRVRHLGQEEP